MCMPMQVCLHKAVLNEPAISSLLQLGRRRADLALARAHLRLQAGAGVRPHPASCTGAWRPLAGHVQLHHVGSDTKAIQASWRNYLPLSLRHCLSTPLQGYLLVLFDCPISLLSLAWLLVLALAFVCQPLPGRWQEVDGGSNVLQAVMQGLVQRLGAGSSSEYVFACNLHASYCDSCKAWMKPTAVMRLPRLPAGGQRVSLRHSPAGRWAPLLLLAACAAADFAAQALLPAAAAADAAGWISLPAGLLNFLQSVVGLSHQAQGLDLAVLLLRPLALLATLALLRPAFCLGMLHRQLQEDALPPEVQAARRQVAEQQNRMACVFWMRPLRWCVTCYFACRLTDTTLPRLYCRLHEQLGLRALAKRLLLLHGSKLVALAAFAAAMQQAGAAGLLLIAGVVLLAPALGAPRAGATQRQPLLHAGLTAAAAMAILWILAQTALCVPYIQVRCAPLALTLRL